MCYWPAVLRRAAEPQHRSHQQRKAVQTQGSSCGTGIKVAIADCEGWSGGGATSRLEEEGGVGRGRGGGGGKRSFQK